MGLKKKAKNRFGKYGGSDWEFKYELEKEIRARLGILYGPVLNCIKGADTDLKEMMLLSEKLGQESGPSEPPDKLSFGILAM